LGGFTLPLLVLPLSVMLVPTWKVRLALGICGALAVGLTLEKGLAAHYYAPVTGLIIFLASMGIRGALRTFPPRSIVRPVIGIAFAALFLYMFAFETVKSATEETEFTQFALNRRLTIQSLMRQGPRHLVMVRYAPGRNTNAEWVYNSADIDASSIVWARDMGDAQNSELIDYYRGRQIWLLEPDVVPPRLNLLSPIHDTGDPTSW